MLLTGRSRSMSGFVNRDDNVNVKAVLLEHPVQNDKGEACTCSVQTQLPSGILTCEAECTDVHLKGWKVGKPTRISPGKSQHSRSRVLNTQI